MPKFFCTACNIDFESDKPVKKEYMDYLLGPCSRNVAFCPVCGGESNEKLIAKPQKAEKRRDYCDGNCQHCPGQN